jgi:hypothetical protein
VQRVYALDRSGITPPVVARESLGKLSLLRQIRIGWKRATVAIGGDSSDMTDRLSRKARCPRDGQKGAQSNQSTVRLYAFSSSAGIRNHPENPTPTAGA